jgi:hypothetical protein
VDCTGLQLVIPDKADPEREAVATAWGDRGGEVIRVGRFWDPPMLDPSRVRVYGNDTFCLVLQQKLGLRLTSPADGLIFTVPPSGLGRSLHGATLADLHRLAFPVFVKPLVPKLFRAAVFLSPAQVWAECTGLPNDTEVIVSEVVAFVAEARCFILNGRVLDCAVYEGSANADQAAAFAQSLARDLPGPSVYVMDVGLVPGTGWVVIEFNAAWGAGLNGCDPRRILPAIEAASR